MDTDYELIPIPALEFFERLEKEKNSVGKKELQNRKYLYVTLSFVRSTCVQRE